MYFSGLLLTRNSPDYPLARPVMAEEKKSFKRCDGCKAKLPSKDLHDLCLLCLGGEHNVSTCRICLSLSKQTRKNRALRLRAAIYDAVLSPSTPGKTHSSALTSKSPAKSAMASPSTSTSHWSKSTKSIPGTPARSALTPPSTSRPTLIPSKPLSKHSLSASKHLKSKHRTPSPRSPPSKHQRTVDRAHTPLHPPTLHALGTLSRSPASDLIPSTSTATATHPPILFSSISRARSLSPARTPIASSAPASP
ncbi:uncharacterized protein DKFZp434B061-like [Hemicordylus capensis]|uniref:uncharacterized protein DKFZp434B061-like n=1 Tax=Hemicordylus capensis TaxID=884348 RepID=UPI0023049168|nr:uncharacterized protein DKFZp434B061-like [Hemicordylus capensis]